MVIEQDVVQENADKEGEGDMTAMEEIKDHGLSSAQRCRCCNFLTSLDLVSLIVIVKQES